MIYLWMIPDLTDPRSVPAPLARYTPGGAFEWAPGEPRTDRDELTTWVLECVPRMAAEGTRFLSPHANIQEGPPWPVANDARVLR